MDNDSVFRGLLNFGDDNSSFFPMRLMKVCKLMKGVVADNIRVEDEERRVIFSKSLFSQFEWASRPKRFCLDRELNPDIVFFLVLQQKPLAMPNMSVINQAA